MSILGYWRGFLILKFLNRFWTAIQALFHPTRLGLVEPPNKVEKEEWVLVYGGSGKYEASCTK